MTLGKKKSLAVLSMGAVKVNLNDILDKINDRIFNVPASNQQNDDYIMELNPDNIIKKNVGNFELDLHDIGEHTVFGKGINKKNDADSQICGYVGRDIINCSNLSESADMESYIASASPPVITVDSDLFSSKKKINMSDKYENNNSSGHYF